MYFKNQKFLVAGMSRSGAASTDFLLKRGAVVYMYDDISDAAVRKTMNELSARGAYVLPQGGVASAVDECDVLFAYLRSNRGGTRYTVSYALKKGKKVVYFENKEDKT